MRRQEFISLLSGVAVAWPLAVDAQQSRKVPHVGVLSPGNPPPNDAFHQRERFEAGLRELGWTPNENIVIDYRYAQGKLDRLPALATELVDNHVDVILARGLTIGAAHQATTNIPIVMAADPDPVRNGFVASLAHPGGNITGLSTQALESEAKQLELLRAALPSLQNVVVLTNAKSPDPEQTTRTATAAQSLGLNVHEFAIGDAGQLAGALAAIVNMRADAVLFRGTLWFLDPVDVATLVLKYRLPTIHNLREFAEAGALMSYGVNFAELHRRSAAFVDKILKGAKPGDLPVEQPTKFELLINLKTAKALGITIPPSIMVRADEVIE
jgi:putative ABC transport system substrate-binding protein